MDPNEELDEMTAGETRAWYRGMWWGLSSGLVAGILAITVGGILW